MAKIHPNTSINSNGIFSSSSEKETFTVWMKSLVFNGNGCTVFNRRGEVVFRVDNYQKRCSSKTFLMDSRGKTLFSIYRKRLRIFNCWEGFKCSKVNKEKPWFQVRRNLSIFRKDMSCKVLLKCDQNSTSYYNYKIVGLEGKSSLKIIDCSGQILAEAIEKQSSFGVPLGEDVLTLMVEPHAADQDLIMALVTVYGLITNKL